MFNFWIKFLLIQPLYYPIYLYLYARKSFLPFRNSKTRFRYLKWRPFEGLNDESKYNNLSQFSPDCPVWSEMYWQRNYFRCVLEARVCVGIWMTTLPSATWSCFRWGNFDDIFMSGHKIINNSQLLVVHIYNFLPENMFQCLRNLVNCNWNAHLTQKWWCGGQLFGYCTILCYCDVQHWITHSDPHWYV